MLDKELIKVIVEDQICDKIILRKLDNAFKMIEDALSSLDSYIIQNVPELFQKGDISKIEEYSVVSNLIKQEIELIQKFSDKTSLTLDTVAEVVSKPKVETDEASELHILDINTKLCCEEKLEDKYTMVYIFDKDGVIETTKNLWTKYCHVCDRHYVYADMATVLVRSFGDKIHIQGQSYNIQTHNEITVEEQTICKYHACNDNVYRDGYCKYHYSYEHYTSK